jgi:chromate reductase
MPTRRPVAIIVGSLRAASWTRKAAQALAELAPPELEPRFLEIGHLPLYNEDLDREGQVPPAWSEFRRQVRAADGVLFATPEYNRGVPGCLKNAVDVASRPYGRSAWNGKPAAVVSVSPGAIGGFGANHHLRQSLVFLNMPTMQQPEAYIGGAANLFAEDGRLREANTREFFQGIMQAFAGWVALHAARGQAAAAS